MAILRIKGLDISVSPVKDSFNRRSTLFKNNIIKTVKRIGVNEEQTDIDLEPFAIKPLPASATFYYEGHRMFYSYAGEKKFVDNLQVVYKVIEAVIDDFLLKNISQDDFIAKFAEDDDVEEQRKHARKMLGVDEDSRDLELINKNYKELAKRYHPDMPEGDLKKFKEINKAHKLLKKELF